MCTDDANPFTDLSTGKRRAGLLQLRHHHWQLSRILLIVSGLDSDCSPPNNFVKWKIFLCDCRLYISSRNNNMPTRSQLSIFLRVSILCKSYSTDVTIHLEFVRRIRYDTIVLCYFKLKGYTILKDRIGFPQQS